MKIIIHYASPNDEAHVAKIEEGLHGKDVTVVKTTGSAHKEPAKVMKIVEEYNATDEPCVFITVAGRSNALSGLVAANSKHPVIACPPFSDKADYLTNIHSSLQMPSGTPAMTVIDPGNAALAALRILGVA